MQLFQSIHRKLVHSRRVNVLAHRLANLINGPATVLDVGCGDGQISKCVLSENPELKISGVEVLVRDTTAIPVELFNGLQIPHPDASFDYVMLIDVLHHTDDPMCMLREARRVARKSVLIKDHLTNGLFAIPTLRLMDWAGNAGYGVRIPFNYWSYSQWHSAFQQLGLEVNHWETDLRMYPRPVDYVCGRELHFIARLNPEMN